MDDIKPDKTQELLHRMATIEIEATLRRAISDNILQEKADALNKSGVSLMAYHRGQMLGEVSGHAMTAALGYPIPRVTLH